MCVCVCVAGGGCVRPNPAPPLPRASTDPRPTGRRSRALRKAAAPPAPERIPPAPSHSPPPATGHFLLFQEKLHPSTPTIRGAGRALPGFHRFSVPYFKALRLSGETRPGPLFPDPPASQKTHFFSFPCKEPRLTLRADLPPPLPKPQVPRRRRRWRRGIQ